MRNVEGILGVPIKVFCVFSEGGDPPVDGFDDAFL